MGITVCPLGLCRTEEDCPNAPCIECMRRLGEHMIEEIAVVGRQTMLARYEGRESIAIQFEKMLADLGVTLSTRGIEPKPA